MVNSNAPLDMVGALCGDEMEQFRKLCVLRCMRPDAVVPGVMRVRDDAMTR